MMKFVAKIVADGRFSGSYHPDSLIAVIYGVEHLINQFLIGNFWIVKSILCFLFYILIITSFWEK